MHTRTEMIDDLDDILNSDEILGSDAPSNRDDPRFKWHPRLGWSLLARMHPWTGMIHGSDDILKCHDWQD
jgi:hypothetical protein